MSGLYVLLLTLAVSAAAGVLWAARRGRMRVLPASGADDLMLDATALRALGGEPGRRATLVQFSSAFCAPCRATRRVLREVADMVDGVAYVEVDAERNLEAVRRLRVMRTPTTFVLDGDGRVVVRASGQPRKPDVLAALGRAVSR